MLELDPAGSSAVKMVLAVLDGTVSRSVEVQTDTGNMSDARLLFFSLKGRP